MRRLAKRWLGAGLSEQWPLASISRWWAIGGLTKAIHDQNYLNNAYNYILHQRTTPLPTDIR